MMELIDSIYEHVCDSESELLTSERAEKSYEELTELLHKSVADKDFLEMEGLVGDTVTAYEKAGFAAGFRTAFRLMNEIQR